LSQGEGETKESLRKKWENWYNECSEVVKDFVRQLEEEYTILNGEHCYLTREILKFGKQRSEIGFRVAKLRREKSILHRMPKTEANGKLRSDISYQIALLLKEKSTLDEDKSKKWRRIIQIEILQQKIDRKAVECRRALDKVSNKEKLAAVLDREEELGMLV